MNNLEEPASRTAIGRGFTLVELLVVIAIIGVLVGMSLPAMQNMRELTRRSNCEHNLVQLSLALSSYASRNGHYPVGTVDAAGPIKNVAEGYHHNWLSALLPMLDASNIHQAIDYEVSVYHPNNLAVRDLRLPVVLCPSATDLRESTSCYAGIHASTETPIDENNDGVFLLNRPIRDRDITDGLSYTIFLGEKLSAFNEDFGWMSGTRSTIRNTGHAINADRARVRGPQNPQQKPVANTYVGGLASDHSGGAYVMMGSGEYQFRSASMDAKLLQQLASRAGGEIPQELKTMPSLADVTGKAGATGNAPAAGNAAAPGNAAATGDANVTTPDDGKSDAADDSSDEPTDATPDAASSTENDA